MIISFEGIQGSGKTTAFKYVTRRLDEAGIPFLSYKFPRELDQSGSEFISLAKKNNVHSPDIIAKLVDLQVQDFFNAADYIQRQEAKGAVILIDRYIDSLFAYQFASVIESPGINPPIIQKIWDDLAVDERLKELPLPDRVLWFDIDPTIAQRRKETRDNTEAQDAFSSLKLQCQAQRWYLAQSLTRKNWHRIDASRTQYNVEDETKRLVYGCISLGESFSG